MKHILLSNLGFKAIKQITPLPNFLYEKADGAWISVENRSLLILHKNFIEVGTKKKDIEVGEDQK